MAMYIQYCICDTGLCAEMSLQLELSGLVPLIGVVILRPTKEYTTYKGQRHD